MSFPLRQTHGDPAPGIRLGIERITPDRAADILREWNMNYRSLNEEWAKQLAEMMRAGWFQPNFQDNVVFDAQGYLRNGQHRLRACVICGIPLTVGVVYGIQDEADEEMDKGRKRTLVQVLNKRGEKNGKDLSSALRILVAYQRYEEFGSTHALRSGGAITQPSALDALRRHPRIRDQVSKCQKIRPVLGSGYGAVILEVGDDVASDDRFSSHFIDGLATGAGLVDVDPILKLRERLNAEKRDKAKLPRVERLAIIIKAWNAMVEGREVKQLRWRGVPPAEEPFPKIRRVSEVQ